MAVSLYFGMTQSGKSYRAHEEAKTKKRVVVFDYAHCFLGGIIINDFSAKSIGKVFDTFHNKNEYCIIMRPTRNDDDVKAFDVACALATALGRSKPKGEENLVFIIDEADMICTATVQSRQLKLVINKGRHDGVDTWAISRIPQRLHSDIRANASRLVCFKLSEHLALSAIGRITGGGETLKAISGLEQYSYIDWNVTGNWEIKNANGKTTRKFSYAKTRNINKGL